MFGNYLKKNDNLFYFIIFIILGLIIGYWAWFNKISILYASAITVAFFLVRAIGDFRPKFFAFIYTHRQIVSFATVFICLSFAGYFASEFKSPDYFNGLDIDHKVMILSQILIQGIVVGVLSRVILLDMFASIIRAENVVKSSVFVAFSFLVFLFLFPISTNHRWMSPVFMLGCGLGFFLHFATRRREQKSSLYKKFKLRILETAEGENLSDREKQALNLFVNRKWKKLQSFISNGVSTRNIEFMELSMLHAVGEYEKALNKLDDIKKSSPPNDLSHFHYLHVAINESEKFDHRKDWKNLKIIRDSLKEAISLNPNCMMTNANLALYLVNKNKGTQFKDPLNLIWKAIKEYENNTMDSLISLITGMGVPVTYAYLLDIYAYVLLKKGKTRFAKQFLFQCLYLDPNHSSTYLHLAEYYYILCTNSTNSKYAVKYKHWKKTAKMCLHIARFLERRKKNTNGGSLIYNRAEQLLGDLRKHA